jgi:hypothetical protein
MLFGLPGVAKNHVEFRTSLFESAALAALLCGALLFNGCGGGSAPGASSTAPAGTTTPSSTSTSGSSSSASSLTVPTSVPPATQGSSYSTTVKVTGGTAPYSFSIASGALPQGLGLADSSGTISGTPAASGTANFILAVSDSAGNSKQQALQLAVASTASSASPESQSAGPSFTNLQHSGGWGQYGQQGPNYVDCSPSPCNGIAFSMTQGVQSPSLSGEATEFNVGGTAGFSDALFNNHLIGPSSSQGMPDSDQSVVPSLHDFTYDVYFYGDDFGPSQALEFDINQFFGNLGFIWGHECRIASGNEWDVWDNQNQYWKHTGVACNPNANSWNHLTLKVQRTSDNNLVYQSITLNGVTSTLNWTFPAGSTPGWYGLTINYQMDGNQKQQSYNVYLDQLTFSYQ